jgi:hypothetical protein
LPATEKANQKAVADVADQAAKQATTKGASPQSQEIAKTQLAVLRTSLAQIAVSGENDFLKKRAASALAEAPPDRRATEGAISEVIDTKAEQKPVPPRVYLQISSEDQRKTAASDLNTSSDIKTHFEVWASNSSFK